MIRTFKVRDMCNKHRFMGTVRYNTENKRFSFTLADNYDKCHPDLFMLKCIKDGIKEMPQWMVDLWIDQRVCPPNRQGIQDILDAAGLEEYDIMGIIDLNHGMCDMDQYYFEEIGGMLEYRKQHDKYWKDYEKYLEEHGDKEHID